MLWLQTCTGYDLSLIDVIHTGSGVYTVQETRKCPSHCLHVHNNTAVVYNLYSDEISEIACGQYLLGLSCHLYTKDDMPGGA